MSVRDRFTLGRNDAGKRGVKQFGVTLWGHSARFGLQVDLWRWQFQIMWERKTP